MKNRAKIPETPKPPPKAVKPPAKKRRIPAQKRKTSGTSDAVRAVLLAGALIAAAACVSMAVIAVHTAMNRPAVGFIPGRSAPAKTDLIPGAGPPAASSAVPPKADKAPGPVQTVSALPAASPPEQPRPERRRTLAFVIDDAGNNLNELEPFLRFPGPLTIAVLPGLPYSAEAARRIRAAGKEVFLHQPMEAQGGQDPGPGAIYAGMSAAEIRGILKKNIAEIGPIAGMNNHQGSKITADQGAMETVLAFCREQGLYFLDSRTTAETAAPAAAKRLGIEIVQRDIFIDNDQSRAAMTGSIKAGLLRAERQDRALMIGHAWSPDLAPLLTGLYDSFTDQGYTLSTASGLIQNSRP